MTCTKPTEIGHSRVLSYFPALLGLFKQKSDPEIGRTAQTDKYRLSE
jgi:hypothetical protein